MVELGYLSCAPRTRAYFPSLRVMMLGDWLAPRVSPSLSRESLSELSHKVGEGVLVGRKRGTRLQYVSCIPADAAADPALFGERPLVASSSGRAILSGCSEAVVRRIVRRSNAETALEQHRLREEAVLAAIRRIQETGVSETARDLGGETEHHAISVAVPVAIQPDLVSVSVYGPRRRILRRRDQIIAALHDWKRSAPSASAPA